MISSFNHWTSRAVICWPYLSTSVLNHSTPHTQMGKHSSRVTWSDHVGFKRFNKQSNTDKPPTTCHSPLLSSHSHHLNKATKTTFYTLAHILLSLCFVFSLQCTLIIFYTHTLYRHIKAMVPSLKPSQNIYGSDSEPFLDLLFVIIPTDTSFKKGSGSVQTRFWNVGGEIHSANSECSHGPKKLLQLPFF